MGCGPRAPARAGPEESADAADDQQQRRVGVGIGIGRPVACQDAVRQDTCISIPPLLLHILLPTFSLALPLPGGVFPRLLNTRRLLCPLLRILTHTPAPPPPAARSTPFHFLSLLMLDASVSACRALSLWLLSDDCR